MNRRSGLTLVELVVVLTILVALATLIIPMFGNLREESQITVTRATMKQLAEVLGRYKAENGSYPAPLNSQIPSTSPIPQMRYLFVDPRSETTLNSYDRIARRGWNGPYLSSGFQSYMTDAYAADGRRNFTWHFGQNPNPEAYPPRSDPTPVDGWNRPIVIVRLIANGLESYWLQSAGPDGELAVQYHDDEIWVNGSKLLAPPESSPTGGSIFHVNGDPFDDLVLLLQAPRSR